MVRVRVASATEGAAPNNPAKLLGLRTSPSTAKADTKRPPTTNLMKVSVMLIRGQLRLRLREAHGNTNPTTMQPATASMTPVEIQPMTHCGFGNSRPPVIFPFVVISLTSTLIGPAHRPLITALQKSAL